MTDPLREELLGVAELGEYIADENVADDTPVAGGEPVSNPPGAAAESCRLRSLPQGYAPIAMNDSPNDVDTRRYFQTCFGDAQGWLCMAVGLKPYRDEKDKYQHGRWSEVAFRWPQEVDNALTYIAKSGPLGDVYACPYPMREPHRQKGNAGQRVLVHADVDRDLGDEEVAQLGGFMVRSGSPATGMCTSC